MKTIVLLSEANDPISGRPHLSRLEAQAIGLAANLDKTPQGLHVGPSEEGASAALGHGRHHGAQAGVDEDRVRYRGGRLDEHLAERKVDRLEMRPEQRAIRLG